MFEFVDVKYKDIIDVSHLIFPKQQVTSLIGASGSGKTTILRMLNKMISPTSGKIMYKGNNLEQMDSIAVRKEVAMLSQHPTIFEGSIRDNLNMGLHFQGKELAGDQDLKQVLNQVHLSKDLNGNASTLSGGEKQRLALGRLILLNPEVYLLDEPSSALDDATEELLIQTIITYAKKQEKTIIMATHSKTIAKKYSTQLIEIVAGKCKGV